MGIPLTVLDNSSVPCLTVKGNMILTESDRKGCAEAGTVGFGRTAVARGCGSAHGPLLDNGRDAGTSAA